MRTSCAVGGSAGFQGPVGGQGRRFQADRRTSDGRAIGNLVYAKPYTAACNAVRPLKADTQVAYLKAGYTGKKICDVLQ
jgi:hypothetical protein